MKQSKKMHDVIDFIFMMLPFILLGLSVFRNGDFDFESFENGLSAFRSFDFGLSDYLIANIFNNTTNVYILFLFDIMMYYVVWKLLDLVYYAVSFIIDFARSCIDRFGGGSL